MPTAQTPAANESSQNEVIRKMIQLLFRVPPEARPSFARQQLLRSSPAIVTLLDSIPPDILKKSVLYLVPNPHSREQRLAAAAKLAGWEPILIHGGHLSPASAKVFNHSGRIQGILDLVFACWLFKGPITHCFTLSGDHALLVAQLKPRRLVLDFYDTCSGMLYMKNGEPQAERTAIGLANGLVHRDLRIRHLQRLYHYPEAKHNLFMYDPLPNEEIQGLQGRAYSSNDKIHVCSIGWIGKPVESVMRVSNALCQAGVHVHAHLNSFEARAADVVARYTQFAKEHPSFHLEPTLSGDAYWNALARYDFGLCVCEPLIYGEPLGDVTPDYIAGCGSSRLADYVRARLGVICTPGLRFQHFWASRYAAALISATPQWLNDPLPALHAALAKMKTTPPPVLGKITVQGVAARLGRFYEAVASS